MSLDSEINYIKSTLFHRPSIEDSEYDELTENEFFRSYRSGSLLMRRLGASVLNAPNLSVYDKIDIHTCSWVKLWIENSGSRMTEIKFIMNQFN